MKQYKPFIDEQFKSVIKSNKLIGIDLFQVNDNFFGFPKRKLWIIDGGIQLNFMNSIFSLAWSQATDSFVFENKKFNELYKEDNFLELDIDILSEVKNKKIVNTKIKWLEYDVILDYTMATKKELKLVEIIIEFEYNEFLQIATIDYDLEENSSPKNYSYDINNELLISLNKEIEIKK